MTNDDLAVTLSILRIIRRWSQSELAEAAGVTNSAISDYERGKVDPQTQTLQKLIRALGLPLSALDQTQAFIQMIRAQMSAPARRWIPRTSPARRRSPRGSESCGQKSPRSPPKGAASLRGSPVWCWSFSPRAVERVAPPVHLSE